jgi:hypothetical protein
MNATADDRTAHKLLDGVDPSCEWREANKPAICTTEASWLLRVSCGDSAFFCDAHRSTFDADLGERSETPRCANHGGRGVRYDWVRVD